MAVSIERIFANRWSCDLLHSMISHHDRKCAFLKALHSEFVSALVYMQSQAILKLAYDDHCQSRETMGKCSLTFSLKVATSKCYNFISVQRMSSMKQLKNKLIQAEYYDIIKDSEQYKVTCSLRSQFSLNFFCQLIHHFVIHDSLRDIELSCKIPNTLDVLA